MSPTRPAPAQTRLRPAMPHGGEPQFDGALWIGEVQENLPDGDLLELDAAEAYPAARLLVRRGRHLRGFVEVPVVDGAVETSAVAAAIAELPDLPVLPVLAAAAASPRGTATEAVNEAATEMALPFSVVLCTRDRPEPLRAALTSLVALDYPAAEIIVVDNASRTPATAQVVAEFAAVHGADRIRLVTETRPGLAKARNTGVLAARHPYLAFTDDDVIADPSWLRGLGAGFARTGAGEVGCVTGIVPSGELRGRSQLYFERRVWWSSNLTPRLFSLSSPPAGEPLFPFRVGLYGTGANFAVRRSSLIELGGFDEGLGVGSPTGGGEDIDIFVRVLQAGHALAYEPSALIWHRHREDSSALLTQARGYGLGLGAWLTTVALDRHLAASAARRSLGAVRHLLVTTKVDAAEAPADNGTYAATLRRAELLAVLRGPGALLRARRAGARRRPLAGSPTTLGA